MKRRTYAVIGFLTLLVAAGFSWAWSRRPRNETERAVEAYQRGDWRRAFELARARVQSHPKDVDALRLLARSSIRIGREASGRAIYGQLGGLDALQPEDLYLLGQLLRRHDEREAADHCWEKALESDPNHASTLDELARSRIDAKRLAEAAELAERLGKLAGWEARSAFLLGQVREAQGDFEQAEADWRRALDKDPRADGAPLTADAYRKRLARAALRLGRPSTARAALQNVLQSGSDPEASWLLSRAWLQEGAIPKAEAAWKLGASYREENPLEAEPAPYVGAALCKECHAAIYQVQQHGPHAQTYHPVDELSPDVLPTRPTAEHRDGPWSYGIIRGPDRLEFQSRRGNEVYRAIVDYAFGSGDRGLTLVAHDAEGRARECRLSCYGKGRVWDVTTGQPPTPPAGEHALGRVLSDEEVTSCFGCHTTVARAARSRTGPTAADRGIGCEHCHGPGGNHVRAVAARPTGFDDLAIAQPTAATAAQVVALCGECHGRREGLALQRNDPTAVRFQATTLPWSRCYVESDGRLDCRTCHDPHRSVETSPQYYERKCLECHMPRGARRDDSALSTRATDAESRLAAAACPVNPTSGCIGCHLPPQQGVFPHTIFSDHYIRVRRDEPADPAPRTGTFTR